MPMPLLNFKASRFPRFALTFSDLWCHSIRPMKDTTSGSLASFLVFTLALHCFPFPNLKSWKDFNRGTFPAESCFKELAREQLVVEEPAAGYPDTWPAFSSFTSSVKNKIYDWKTLSSRYPAIVGKIVILNFVYGEVFIIFWYLIVSSIKVPGGKLVYSGYIQEIYFCHKFEP